MVEEAWDARCVHELCARVLRQSSPRDENVRDFAERVAETEIRILLSQTLRRAGFEFDDNVVLMSSNSEARQLLDAKSCTGSSCSETPIVVDTDVALSAKRKLSSAHVDFFRSHGSVILRQVVDNPSNALSAAAGIACRVLEAPACRLVTGIETITEGVEILVADGCNDSTGSLAAGDMLARKSTGGVSNESVFVFQAVAPEDPSVTFVDPLYGSRGETPTSVFQWSKGTI
jgi:hypothetical protein